MVKIVTDSVASIPAEVVRARDIEVVSLFVNRDGREYREADMDVDAFYEDIADMIDNPPTSSQPSQHAMETIFEKAAQAADEVLGVFISCPERSRGRCAALGPARSATSSSAAH